MISKFKSTGWKHLACILIISLFIIFNFFVIEKIADYPWWHSTGNDLDAAFAGTTLALLHGTGFTLIYHPGASIYHYHGVGYRILNAVSPAHQEMFNLYDINDAYDAADVFEIWTKTSRVFVLIMALVFLAILYGVFFQVTADILLSFGFTFFIMTSMALSWQTYWVRPDLPSLLFLLAAVFLSLLYVKKPLPSLSRRIAIFGLIGYCLGYAVFSKIQIVPPIAIYLFLAVIYLTQYVDDRELIEKHPKNLWCGLVFSVVNLLIMPWWALKRPAFLTDEYLLSLGEGTDLRKLYGPAPESFVWLFLILLLGLCVVSGLIVLFNRKGLLKDWIFKAFSLLFFVNLLAFGVIASTYTILLPAAGGFFSYIENTNHLIYSMLTNIFYGAYLENRVISIGTFIKVHNLHALTSRILNINVLYFTLLASVASLVRLFQRNVKNKRMYVLVLVLFAVGLMMDVLSSLRIARPYIQRFYAVFSICFYGIGLAGWITLELRRWKENLQKKNAHLILYRCVIGFFIAHVILISWQFKTKPRASGVTDQEPLQEYLNTRGHAIPFWELVDQIIEDKKHRQE